MLKVILYLMLVGGIVFVSTMGEQMIGKGVWDITSVEKCDNDDLFALGVDIDRKKFNRTHYWFDAKLHFTENMDSDLMLEIIICKWVDGGCKQYQIIKDDNMGSFTKKIAEKNTKAVLTKFGIPGEDFPIPEGHFELTEYLLDICEFPCESVLGVFTATVVVKTRMGVDKGCIIATVEFREPKDGEQMCEKCEDW